MDHQAAFVAQPHRLVEKLVILAFLEIIRRKVTEANNLVAKLILKSLEKGIQNIGNIVVEL
ncbi:hypothetical protein MWU63_12285 [Pseudohalocynthiibacter sp. F2068]|nr:hypothetical protein [Pseudohalocynthiibacter sp. F2068]